MKQIILLLSLFFAVSVNAQKKIIVTGGGGGTPIDTTGQFVTAVEGVNDTTAVAWKGGVPELITLKGVQDLQSVTDRDSITTRKVTVRDFAISDVPKFDNNDSAIANGLIKGDVYRLPYDTTKKAYLLAITDLPPPSDSLLLRILTNDAGASLPFSNQSEFESAFIGDNPSLIVTSYELVGDELTVVGTGLNYLTDNIFSNNYSIVEVGSETLLTIGDNAFFDCASLTDISFPLATTIGDNAFNQCYSLTSVSFPSATTIGDGAFSGCTYLADVSFPLATTIGDNAFNSCASLTDISFPLVTTIGEYAIYQCYSLTSVSFPLATTIGDGAFSGCTYLADVSFPSAATIGEYAFGYCEALTEVNLTNFPLVTYWGDNSLIGCTSLELFETNATTIRPSTLDGCYSLEEVKLNNATALFDIFDFSSAYNSAVPMLFRMPNLNNIINDPFGILISTGVIDSGTDFTIEIPSAMTGNAKITAAQSAGAIIVGL